MSRPEPLFPLFADLETLPGVGPKAARAYAGLGIARPRDLLFLLPHSGIDRTRVPTVQGAAIPGIVTVEVTIGPHYPPKVKGRPYRVHVRDATTDFQVAFFHARGDYINKLLPEGERRILSGKVEFFDGIAQMVHPDHVLEPDEAADLPRYEPVYPLTAGRLPIRTALISDTRIDEVVDHLARAVAEGRQAYWVCPLVEDSEAVDYASAEARFSALRAALGDVVGLVHGQMPPAEKDAAMARFVAGATKVLVATTVIEVGVNVPNASIMVVERAEIFGLAQLHQLRGRVGRGTAASTCLLMYQAPLSDAGERRLTVIRDTEDGFRIAEEDLAMRGAGDLIGTAQSGLPRFRIADLERQANLMAVAQTDARRLLADDPTLEGPRGRAARMLLWLLDQDRAIRLISVG